MTFQKMLAIIAVAAAVISFVSFAPAGLDAATAPATAPMITYTATGTFASVPISGADQLKLAGEPFTVTISVSAATVPFKTGPGFAAYNKLTLKGEVHTPLAGSNTPVFIATNAATIVQGITPNVGDTFIMEAPIKVPIINILVDIKSTIQMPLGTITKPLLHPFTAVTLTPSNATLSYSDNNAETVLAIASGTLTAVTP